MIRKFAVFRIQKRRLYRFDRLNIWISKRVAEEDQLEEINLRFRKLTFTWIPSLGGLKSQKSKKLTICFIRFQIVKTQIAHKTRFVARNTIL